MHILGLTGSIGTGKSTVAKMLKGKGIPVHDADATVHDLLESNLVIIEKIAVQFPQAISNHQVDRSVLRKIVLDDLQKMTSLEKILHPAVEKSQITFLKEHQKLGTPIVVLEIPLLYEKGYETLCDKVLVVSCSSDRQQQRLNQRLNLTAQDIDAILSLQWPSEQKEALANWVIDTNGPPSATLEQLDTLLKELTE